LWSGIPTLSLDLPTGGNHWSDWIPPDHPDEDNDGIVDDPRMFASNMGDYFPYVSPNGWATNQPPNWDKGKKKGWDGSAPPGLDKKDKTPSGFDKGKKTGWDKTID